MSFKREGDDASQLRALKKRRVSELLANYIPEDEALLLRNGRYACTVCFHRPVFDTLDMLTVHRSGKRHLASLQKFYGKKHSLEKEVLKRQQEAEESGAQVAVGPAPLLAQTRKITRNALLKSVPYNSCCRPRREAGSDSGPSTSRAAAGFKNVERVGRPRSSALVGEKQPMGGKAGHTVLSPGTSSPAAELVPEKKSIRPGKGHTVRKAPSEPEDLTLEKRQTFEHYLKLKSSGWIQDRSGKWIKDENVEFDSDEEDPPLLPPS